MILNSQDFRGIVSYYCYKLGKSLVKNLAL